MVGPSIGLVAMVVSLLLHIVWAVDDLPLLMSREPSSPDAVLDQETSPAPSTAPSQQEVVDVALDAGHSIAEAGALGGGLREADLTLEMAYGVKTILEERGISVLLTRVDEHPLSTFSATDAVERVREEQEARIAAAGRARIYVSMHVNGHPITSIRGIETYYNADNHGEESLRLASLIQQHVVAAVRSTGYEVPDRGVQEDLRAGKPYGHFFSLRGDRPSALVETLFLTNGTEARLLAEPAYRQAIAEGVAAGIEEYLTAPVYSPGTRVQ